MRFHRGSIVFCLFAMFCQAQPTRTDKELLTQVREKYDEPFDSGLQSFSCAINFNWKQHWTETTRVGDEGTDEEIEKLVQPIKNSVVVTRQNATPSSGLSDDTISKLPHGGMAELLLEHAVQNSLNTWLTAATNSILPNPGAPVSFEQSPSGYKLSFKVRAADVEMVLGPDMRLQSEAVKGDPSDHIETSFAPAQHGFVLTSLTMGENGNFVPGNRLIYTYTYQIIDGVELPEHVAIIRESHHEVWRYTLSDCTVKTNK